MIRIDTHNRAFIRRAQARLNAHARHLSLFDLPDGNLRTTSAVLLLLSPVRGSRSGSAEVCLILNKRSAFVKQPGDLCCPGGGVAPRLDRILARVVQLPGLALSGWTYGPWWRRRRPRTFQHLCLFLATALREATEEIRLNPLGVRFLGPLPCQRLVLFQRTIHPLAGWVPSQRRFFPNWEVDKMVFIPLRRLFDPSRYARFRLSLQLKPDPGKETRRQDFPCFVAQQSGREEILWGVTFRIAMSFLKIVFGFDPPPIRSLPVIHGHRDAGYLNPTSRRN